MMPGLKNVEAACTVERDETLDTSADITSCLNTSHTIKVKHGNILVVTIAACTMCESCNARNIKVTFSNNLTMPAQTI